jgi:hypothetical protein
LVLRCIFLQLLYWQGQFEDDENDPDFILSIPQTISLSASVKCIGSRLGIRKQSIRTQWPLDYINVGVITDARLIESHRQFSTEHLLEMLFYADKYNEKTNHKIPMHAKAIQKHFVSDIRLHPVITIGSVPSCNIMIFVIREALNRCGYTWGKIKRVGKKGAFDENKKNEIFLEIVYGLWN